MSTDSTLWFYFDVRNTQRGPVSEVDMKWLLSAKQLTMDSYVWCASLDGWKYVKDLEQFCKYLNTVDKDEHIFYMSSGNIKNGPITKEVFQLLYKSNQLHDGSLIWMPGFDLWKKVGDVDSLTSASVGNVVEEVEEVAQNVEDAEPVQTEEQEKKRQHNREVRQKRKLNSLLKKVESITVYVTGLPLDITEEEVAVFFRKAGALRLDEHGHNRIKLYKLEDGTLKGDGTVKYLNKESVDQAVDLQHESYIRPNCKVTVQHAEIQSIGTLEPVKYDRQRAERLKLINKQADAIEDGQEVRNGQRMVVIKHIASEEELMEYDSEDAYVRELEDDLVPELTEQCGEVDKVNIYPYHADAPAVVLFASTVSAQKCIELFNKRFFAGRVLECGYFDGTDYTAGTSKEEEEERRLKNFGDWLENE